MVKNALTVSDVLEARRHVVLPQPLVDGHGLVVDLVLLSDLLVDLSLVQNNLLLLLLLLHLGLLYLHLNLSLLFDNFFLRLAILVKDAILTHVEVALACFIDHLVIDLAIHEGVD